MYCASAPSLHRESTDSLILLQDKSSRHSIVEYTGLAIVSEPASLLTTDAADSSPFLGVTPGETEEGLLLH